MKPHKPSSFAVLSQDGVIQYITDIAPGLKVSDVVGRNTREFGSDSAAHFARARLSTSPFRAYTELEAESGPLRFRCEYHPVRLSVQCWIVVQFVRTFEGFDQLDDLDRRVLDLLIQEFPLGVVSESLRIPIRTLERRLQKIRTTVGATSLADLIYRTRLEFGEG